MKMRGHGSQGVLPVMALLLAVMLLVFGTNLQGVLLPMLGHERGSSMTAVGLFSAGWSAGFVVACACVGQLLGRLGYVGAFVTLAGISAFAAALLYPLPTDQAWIGLRVIIGFCYGGLSAIIEGWLVEQAGSGIAFASYMVANLVASLCGTLSLDLIDLSGPAPFAFAVGAVALSAVPIVFGRIPSPPVPEPFQPQLLTLIRCSPVAALGCVCIGVVTGAVGGLGPVFGLMEGLNKNRDTAMLAANSVGGALAFLPVASLAERIGRRTLLGCLVLLGLAACAPFVLLPQLSARSVILLLGILGFAQYPIYGLCVGLANQEAEGRSAGRIAGELVLLFGLGTIIGPVLGAMFLRMGTRPLFGFIAATLAVLGAVLAGLRPRRPAAPEAVPGILH